LHTNSMDEALWLPTEKSVRVALRTQQIIAHESGISDSIDPLAGSYLVEYMTDAIQSRAEEYISTIDKMGGVLVAIEKGYQQDEIQQAAYNYQKAVECGEEIIVGVNAFQVNEKAELEQLRVNPLLEEAQCSRLAILRSNRGTHRVIELLNQLEHTARSSENLLPLLIVCVENQITLGEICDVFRKVWGEYQPPAGL